ncbi:hypothetical protein FQN50_004683 [Emmonsiellopsis sp. PD_5]|nr:hypothetical protein FQN50_004683 [Emmonsiellopsis sp. PD_5]
MLESNNSGNIKMASLRVLGLNCGTSIDGIDVAHCKISTIPDSNNVEIQVLSYTEIPVTPSIRERILSICVPGSSTTIANICDLNFALGEEFSRAVKASGVDLDRVDIIASHGQTLWHIPEGERKSTLQMAEPAVIAHQTKKTVVSNFRVAELAAGRQGAPLAGFFEGALLAHPHKTRISQNIGGIGNATLIPPTTGPGFLPPSQSASYLAFDTGPGNVMIDATMRLLTSNRVHYDKDGAAGARGESAIDHAAVTRFLSHPYFSTPPPKTTGRELFSDARTGEFVRELQGKGLGDDAVVATVTRVAAESIARAYEGYVLPLLAERKIDEIFVCGGGAENPNIMRFLAGRFPGVRVGKLDEVMGELSSGDGVRLSAAAKEAVMFALLGFLGVCGWTVRGAALAETEEKAVLGVVTPGENYWGVLRGVVGGGEPRVLERIVMR